MEVYLDNSATTKVFPEVCDLMVKIMREDYGNAASLHKKGVEAEKYIRTAAEQIASTMHVKREQILFTSGGTESNNLAILGAAEANKRRGKHILTTVIEHASVKNPMKYLADQGFDVEFLPVDKDGILPLETLKNAMREDTILVSVMFVNNEIGSVQPIAEIGEYIKKNYPETVFHVDAIQAYGKFDIRPKTMRIDLLSASGHKLHGPKGVGFLYIGDGVKLKPLILGGGQQKNMRSGTENVPGSAGLGLAAELMYKNQPENVERMFERKFQLIDILEQIPGTHVNGKKDKTTAPHIVSCSFDDVRSEVLLHALEAEGVYVSSGSACSSSHPSEVSTLLSIGLPKAMQEGTIRFSLCEETTEEDIRYTGEVLNKILPLLRRFTRK